jgi:hypoxanthine-guanine phosphoribosyltransferase
MDVLVPDTPIDLKYKDSNILSRFVLNLRNGVVELKEQTYREITKTLTRAISKTKPSLTFKLAPYAKVKRLKNYYINFGNAFREAIENVNPYLILFLGRSTKPLVAYLFLSNYLKRACEDGIKLIFLSSRDEKMGGLKERLIKEYLNSLKGEKILVVDDVTNTGRTLDTVRKLTASPYLSACVAIANLDSLKARNKFRLRIRRTSNPLMLKQKEIYFGTGICGSCSVNPFSHFYRDSLELIRVGWEALGKKLEVEMKELERCYPLDKMFLKPLQKILYVETAFGYMREIVPICT